MRCLLIGNYGVGNIGDEALRTYFEKTFPDIQWIVMTSDGRGKNEVPRMPFGMRSFLRPWWRTIAHMRRCDAAVFGGGSLFTDTESPKACGIWWWQGFWARCTGLPLLMAFEGVGPISTRFGSWCTRWVLQRSMFVSVRDDKSVERVYKIAGELMHTKVVQSFDPVLALFLRKNHQRSKKLIIIPRANSTPSFFDEVTKVVAQKHWQEIRVLLMDPQCDCVTAIQMMKQLSLPSTKFVDLYSLEQLTTEIEDAEYVVTQRYHGGIAALALGVPFLAVPQREGDKLDTLQDCNIPECARLVQQGEAALRSALQAICLV